ncbi:hypothetical protein HDZ31DRAFT_32727 [Schizophyllum fasciatum]
MRGNDMASLSYDPAGAWFEGQLCQNCRARPDANTAYNGTWHHTTDDNTIDTQDTTLTIQFTGTALYVYCIIANNVSAGTGTVANYDFRLDGQDAGNYHHDPENVADYFYNVPVYAVSGLDNGPHELMVNVAGSSGVSGSSLMLFDYFTYTYEDDNGDTGSSTSSAPTETTTSSSPATSSSDTNVGAIVGGVLGGMAGMTALATALFFYLRRRRGHRAITTLGSRDKFSKEYPAMEPYPAPAARSDASATCQLSDHSIASASPTKPLAVVTRPILHDDSLTSASSPTSSARPSSKARMELDTRVRDAEARIAALQGQNEPPSASTSAENALRRQIDGLQAEIAMLHHQQREMMDSMSAPPPGYSDV